MMDKVSVVRNEQGMTEAQNELSSLRNAFNSASIQDKGVSSTPT
jgi:succinate dehydrogenase/fumarate reductase flavoprotein subunit